MYDGFREAPQRWRHDPQGHQRSLPCTHLQSDGWRCTTSCAASRHDERQCINSGSTGNRCQLSRPICATDTSIRMHLWRRTRYSACSTARYHRVAHNPGSIRALRRHAPSDAGHRSEGFVWAAIFHAAIQLAVKKRFKACSTVPHHQQLTGDCQPHSTVATLTPGMELPTDPSSVQASCAREIQPSRHQWQLQRIKVLCAEHGVPLG